VERDLTPGRRPPPPRGPFLVVGLGRAGLAAAAALADAYGPGAVRGCDSAAPEWAAAEIEALRARGVELHTGTDGLELLAREPEPRCVVKSPGVPPAAPVVAAARERGLPVVAELELGWRLSAAPLVAVTGTNGKSTVSRLLAAMRGAEDLDAAVVGNTDFGPPLSAVAATGSDRLVCEVSSFQLEDCPRLLAEAAVLTNLRVDHVDRHPTMRRYAAVKRRLFVRGRRAVRLAVLPADDSFGATLAREVAARGGDALRFGRGPDADYRLVACDWTTRSAQLDAETPDGPVHLAHRLPGEHNALNVLAAVAAARGLGIGWDSITAALARTACVPGRFEAIDAGQPFDAVVDFAHTPDAVDAVLRTARAVAARRGGRVLALVSTAGQRPRALAEPMGAAAGRLADLVVVTAGSLRGATAPQLIEPVLAGARSAKAAAVEVVADRRLAIRHALAAAGDHDVVMLLGRGARPTLALTSAGDGAPFDDRQVAREELELLLSGRGQPGHATIRAQVAGTWDAGPARSGGTRPGRSSTSSA
jgi:UDP-N-acetylmuramyl tripeptide synthase